MSGKRDYVAEILAKRSRMRKRVDRYGQVARRIYPLVQGFRAIKRLKRAIPFRDEWLKYGAIGYVACIEGYVRLLITDLIDYGPPYSGRITDLREIKFSAEAVVAIHSRKVTLGEFVAHLVPVNSVADIDAHLSALIGTGFWDEFRQHPVAAPWNNEPFGRVFPKTIGELDQLFQFRHQFAHELTTRGSVPVGKIERFISSAASFVSHTEDLVKTKYLAPEA